MQLTYTPLMYTASHGHAKAGKTLLSSGANVHHKDKVFMWPTLLRNPSEQRASPRPLPHTTFLCDPLYVFLRFGAIRQNGYTSLHWACRWGHADMLKPLLSAGADPEARDKVHSRSLIFELVLGRRSCPQALHVAHLVPCALSQNGDRPKDLARENDQTVCVTILDEWKVSPTFYMNSPCPR